MELGVSRKLGIFVYGVKELADKTGDCPFLTLGQIARAHYGMEQSERILVAALLKSGVGLDDVFLGRRIWDWE